jgi:hypothetical protein
MTVNSKLIVRVQSNFGIWKITLQNKKNSEEVKLSEFYDLLSSKYHVSEEAIRGIRTTAYSAMELLNYSSLSLRELGIRNGELFELPELKQIIQERTWITEDGELIPAGIFYVLKKNEIENQNISNLPIKVS